MSTHSPALIVTALALAASMLQVGAGGTFAINFAYPQLQVLASQTAPGLYAVLQTGTVAIVEPGTLFLLGAGLVGLGVIGGLRKKPRK